MSRDGINPFLDRVVNISAENLAFAAEETIRIKWRSTWLPLSMELIIESRQKLLLKISRHFY